MNSYQPIHSVTLSTFRVTFANGKQVTILARDKWDALAKAQMDETNVLPNSRSLPVSAVRL